MCDSSAYATYYKFLAPLALLHVGAQLHGSPAKQPWGWEPTNPPYVLEEALAAREAAVLRCLLGTCVGTQTPKFYYEKALICTRSAFHW